MKVGFLGKYFGYPGGYDFLHMLVVGLLAARQSQELEANLLVPRMDWLRPPSNVLRLGMKSIITSLKERRPIMIPGATGFQADFLDCFSDVAREVGIVYYRDSREELLRCLKTIGAEVTLPVSGSLGPEFPLPWIGYAYDLQHKYFPELFREQERMERDRHFLQLAREAKAIITNSLFVKRDMERFFPDSKGKITPLPFSPMLRKDWLEDCSARLLRKFRLPERYFLISNQFWVHKDHMTAFRALRYLKDLSGVCIVCTGRVSDYRVPEYAREIAEFIEKAELKERVLMLGHVKKREQIELMKAAVALIQPTLFEGGPGGGSVYDAIAIGTPVILSDIEVNREATCQNISWFEAGSSEDLARCMRDKLRGHIDRPSRDMLEERSCARAAELGRTLAEVIRSVMPKETVIGSRKALGDR